MLTSVRVCASNSVRLMAIRSRIPAVFFSMFVSCRACVSVNDWRAFSIFLESFFGCQHRCVLLCLICHGIVNAALTGKNTQ
jgi:hypothetical protein